MDSIPIIIAICDKKSATGYKVALNMGKILETADRADDDEQRNFPLRRLAETPRPRYSRASIPRICTLSSALFHRCLKRRQIFWFYKRREKFPVQAFWRTSAINAQI